ncbi:MAG TPA: ATP-binding cassette domain-containing protein [Clostridia bacterium]|jgi:multidrug/hemolysin transport system ATP-binding protein|nr:MAG: Daunorubicin/doxorubicin resistance ATP-binding protein DrrA [Firmicutes bacterium ADurb.Bin146]HOD93510.1 ATP-binding cassette domain-containing protein [Clostridia bacterium]HQM39810.1 ATP-binding cassette domain-containing protein [Clostridia bacterium]
MDKIIEVKDLSKSYGTIHAVKGISFYVEKGKLFAFLGPNGAGKSTTIDIICTFLKKDSGSVVIDGLELGKDDNAIRNKIGAVFQDGLLDNLLTVEENLIIRGGLYKKDKTELKQAVKETAELMGITDLLKRPYGKLSGGQRRRCDIARALINKPQILFLDEPTTGLDPQTRKSVWEIVQKIQKTNNMTLFLTTHYMEEAAEADYVIIIDEGKISAKGTPSYLKETYAKDKLSLICKDSKKVSSILNGMNIPNEIVSDYVNVVLKETMEALDIIQSLKEHIKGFEVTAGTMDDAFIGITGKEIRS